MRGAMAIILGVVLLQASAVRAVILYPGDSGVPSGSRPPDTVIGSFAGLAGAVAISPDLAITTRHQGGGVGSVLIFGSTRYTVVAEYDMGNADCRVCQLSVEATGQDAHLSSYVPIYTATDEIGKYYTLGGIGGATASDTGTALTWDGSYGTERWGDNRVATTDTNVSVAGFTSDVIESYFYPQADPRSTFHEAAIAAGDSGGGWFIQSNGQWYLAGLSAYTTQAGRTSYSPADETAAIRLSSYATGINAVIATVPEPLALPLFCLLGAALLCRRPRRTLVR